MPSMGWLRRMDPVEPSNGGVAVAEDAAVGGHQPVAAPDGRGRHADHQLVEGDPDEEYFGLINDIQRQVGTYLYGRGMYEAMVYWETAPVSDQPPWIVEFTNTWKAADKVVYSTTLASVASGRTTLEGGRSTTLAAVASERTTVEREFDAEAIRRLKADAPRDLTVGGVPHLHVHLVPAPARRSPTPGGPSSPRRSTESRAISGRRRVRTSAARPRRRARVPASAVH